MLRCKKKMLTCLKQNSALWVILVEREGYKIEKVKWGCLRT